MAYKFKAGESVPESIRRIVAEELESAADQLEGRSGTDREEAIHEARKSLKKSRAIVRLVRSELGQTAKTENKALRDAGRKLSELRDAGAIVRTFDDLRSAFPEARGLDQLDGVRAGLVARRDEAMQHPGLEKRLQDMAKLFRTAAKRVNSWALKTDGFRAIKSGLRDSYRAGRNAMDRASRQPRPENYHEWRKRAKDLWYHVRLLEPVWTEVMQAYEKTLKDLETALGEDHNLVVLREKVSTEPDLAANEKAAALLSRLADRRQKELRRNSMALGARIYEEKPRELTRRMKRLWDEWSSEAAPPAPPKKGVGSRTARPRTAGATSAA